MRTNTSNNGLKKAAALLALFCASQMQLAWAGIPQDPAPPAPPQCDPNASCCAKTGGNPGSSGNGGGLPGLGGNGGGLPDGLFGSQRTGAITGGMPQVLLCDNVHVALKIVDTPLPSTAAVGPSTAFTITYYGQGRATPAIEAASGLGPIWRHNWQALIEDSPASIGSDVHLHWRDGGYWPAGGYQASDGSFARESHSQAQLILVSANPPVYERHSSDGSVEIYAHARTEVGGRRQILLSAEIDPHGNRVDLGYDALDRLETLTDASGRTTRFFYENSAWPTRPTRVQDFAGRSIHLDYNSAGQLSGITDVIGLSSTFSYAAGAGAVLTGMTTPYGATRFASSGGAASVIRGLSITDPLGGQQRYEFASAPPGLTYSVSAAEIPAIPGLYNAYMNYRNTFYWDKRTMAEMGAALDYTRAHIRHWTHDYEDNSRPDNVLESEKRPGQSRVWYLYQNQSNAGISSDSALPIMAGRKLADGTSLIQQYAYNAQGNLTETVDEDGHRVLLTYAPNQIDLIGREVIDASGKRIQSQTWQYGAQHLPTSTTDALGNTTTYQYNGRGQLTLQTDAAGGQSRYQYDSAGQLTARTDPDGGVTRLVWNAAGQLASITDARGNTRHYTWDNLGRPTAITWPDGSRDSYHWNKLDLARHTDRLGRTRTYQWDALRRLTQATDEQGITTGYSYDADGRLLQISHPAGNWQMSYDAGGNLSSVRQPGGHQIDYQRDWAGRITGWSDNRGGSASIALTGNGNPKQETYKDKQNAIALQIERSFSALGLVTREAIGPGQSHNYSYDANARRIGQSNALAETLSYSRDRLQRIASITNPLGDRAHLAYNGKSQTIAAQDYKGTTTQYTRDAAGGITQEASADTGAQQTSLDWQGLARQTKDASGRTSTIERNALGQITQIRHGDGSQSRFTYDSAARLTGIQEPQVATAWTYDNLGRPTGKTQSVTPSAARARTDAIGYTWTAADQNGAGQLAGITYPSGQTLRYLYDATGQLTTVGMGNRGIATAITWTPYGMPTGWDWPFTGILTPTLQASRTYNSAGQLTQSEIASYHYDAAGRLSQAIQNLKAPQSAGNRTGHRDLQVASQISYDAAGRVTNYSQQPDASSFTAGGKTWPVQAIIGPLEASYQWDANGNRTQAHYGQYGGIQNLQSITRNYSHESASNRLASLHENTANTAGQQTNQSKAIQWDASGRISGYNGQMQLGWNAAGQLASSSGATGQGSSTGQSIRYITNALAQRVGKQTGQESTITIYGDDSAWPGLGSYPLVKYSVNSNGTVTSRTEYYYLPTAQGPLPVAVQIDNRLLAVHTDHLNTPRRLSGNVDSAVWQWPMSAFGEVEPSMSATGWIRPHLGSAGKIGAVTEVTFDLRYPGQQFDKETGLNYNHNRYYDPTHLVGYTQADPIGLDGGWNRFGYVEGNPFGYTDPEGLFTLHGNWCGPNWTGGHKKPWDQLTDAEKNSCKPPVDKVDACCEIHDKAHASCRESYPCDERMQRRCLEDADRRLYYCARNTGEPSFIIQDYMRRSSPKAELSPSCKPKEKK